MQTKSSSMIKKVIVGVIVVFVISLVGTLVIIFQTVTPVKVENMNLANISSGGMSLVWTTDKAANVVVEVSQTDDFKEKQVFYDDRDVFESAMNEYAKVADVSRRVHHVTVRGLDPLTQYYVRIKNNLKYEAAMKVSTTQIAETLLTPDPVYGKVLNSKGSELGEGVVLMKKVAADGESQNVSSVLENGTYSMDAGNLMKSDFSGYFVNKDFTENLQLIGLDGNITVKSVDINQEKDQPVKDVNISASEEEIAVQVQNEDRIDIEVLNEGQVNLEPHEQINGACPIMEGGGNNAIVYPNGDSVCKVNGDWINNPSDEERDEIRYLEGVSQDSEGRRCNRTATGDDAFRNGNGEIECVIYSKDTYQIESTYRAPYEQINGACLVMEGGGNNAIVYPDGTSVCKANGDVINSPTDEERDEIRYLEGVYQDSKGRRCNRTVTGDDAFRNGNGEIECVIYSADVLAEMPLDSVEVIPSLMPTYVNVQVPSSDALGATIPSEDSMCYANGNGTTGITVLAELDGFSAGSSKIGCKKTVNVKTIPITNAKTALLYRERLDVVTIPRNTSLALALKNENEREEKGKNECVFDEVLDFVG